MDERLYFRQLRAGRDYATSDPVAAQMANFAYLVGDRVAGECLVVDPAWDVDGIVDYAEREGMRITGALVTHYHPDHCGGAMMGFNVQGITRLFERVGCKAHVHVDELQWVKAVTGVGDGDLQGQRSGDRIRVGEVEVECLHTPGHTPGSQCFRCAGRLIAGDTLFLQGCGRTDLPGGDVDETWRTLTQRLATLPADTVLYPGHDYGDRPSAPLSDVRRTNYALNVPDLASWRRMMGA